MNKDKIEKMQIDFARVKRLKQSLYFDQEPEGRLISQHLFYNAKYQFMADFAKVRAYYEIKKEMPPQELNDLWNDFMEFMEDN